MSKKKLTQVEKQARLERIKELAIIGIFSDDSLMETLVLKGGNALDLIYKISTRSSVDVDFSMTGDFPGGIEALRERVEASLTQTYLENGLRAFDFKVEGRPKTISEDLKSFWGGYYFEFKLIEEDVYKTHSDDLEALRKHAIDLGKGPKFLIDVSRFEYLTGKQERDFQGYSVFVYSPEMILAEKLRALCQQMEEYSPIIKRHGRPGTSRARDFIDIHLLATEGGVNIAAAENRGLLTAIFEAKRVPLDFLNLLPKYKAFHEASYLSVKDAMKTGKELKPFDFYFDFVMDLIKTLQPLGDV